MERRWQSTDPTDVTLDGDGYLFIVDHYNHRILESGLEQTVSQLINYISQVSLVLTVMETWLLWTLEMIDFKSFFSHPMSVVSVTLSDSRTRYHRDCAFISKINPQLQKLHLYQRWIQVKLIVFSHLLQILFLFHSAFGKWQAIKFISNRFVIIERYRFSEKQYQNNL